MPKKSILTLAVLTLLLGALLTGRPRAVSGQTPGAGFLTYMPLISSPPLPPAWVGPDGGFIIAIAPAPSQPATLYAGTWGSGVYRSTDGGGRWVWKSQGLEQPYINSMAVDPHNPQVAYAGTYTGKLYKTIDGGEHWFPSSAGIQEQAIVYSIAVDPLDGENIFIGTRGVSNNGGPPWNGVLYRSTDAGNSWVPVLANVGGASQEDWAYAVTLHPRFPHLVYAATHEHGIYRSLNAGKSWEPVNDGITSMSTRGIVVGPDSAEKKPVLFTGVWKWEGAFRSNNGGDTWFAVGNGSKDTRIYSMSIDPQDGDIVYASTFSDGVLQTRDGGGRWKIIGFQEIEVPVTSVDPQNRQVLYVGTYGAGLYKSGDGGASWAPAQRGLHAIDVSALQISPENPQQYYAGLPEGGVVASADGGQNWVDTGGGLSNTSVLGLVIPPGQPRVLFALTKNDGLHRCEIGGNCWQKLAIDFPLAVQAAIDREHPFWKPSLLEEDLEQPAAVVGTPALLDLCFGPAPSQIAYLGTAGSGVYRSSDGGLTWGATGLSNRVIVSLAANPEEAMQVYAASDTQVWSSADGGANWGDTGLAGVQIYALASAPDGQVYAGTNLGIYQLTPAGWMHLGPDGIRVTALAAHPERAGWLYAGSSDGLQASRNGGLSWEPGPAELQGVTVKDITFDPADPSWLFISTATQGVLRFKE